MEGPWKQGPWQCPRQSSCTRARDLLQGKESSAEKPPSEMEAAKPLRGSKSSRPHFKQYTCSGTHFPSSRARMPCSDTLSKCRQLERRKNETKRMSHITYGISWRLSEAPAENDHLTEGVFPISLMGNLAPNGIEVRLV